jgi:hypothetical protein
LWKFFYFSDNTGQCAINADTASYIFIIVFTIEYSYGCNYPGCQQKFIEEVQNQITTAFQNITLTVTFTNGVTLNVSLSLCSLIETNSSKYILLITSKETI